MEEQTPLKRRREEEQVEEMLSKRQRSFKDMVMSILEDDEEEPNQDLSSLITTLERELSSASTTTSSSFSSSSSGYAGYDSVLNDHFALVGTSSSSTDQAHPFEIIGPSTVDEYCSISSSGAKQGDDDDQEREEGEREKVMRHLLEASDDELGIPNSDGRVEDMGVEKMDGGDLLGLDDGLWEIEDDAANYYALLQSEIFLDR
ncbi:hypothetical protein Dimus_014937 [Dionaea muscipula]